MAVATPNKGATFIYALGKARDLDVATNVRTFLEDEQAAVSRAAARYLGLMQTEHSAAVLLTHLEQESAGAVRGTITESLKSLPVTDTPVAMLTMSNAIKRENDETTRYAMANFMAYHLTKHPEYKTTLQKLLHHDPSKRLRHSIGVALATI
jgi:HEAT repeat protein